MKQEIRETRRAQILDAAAATFAERGYDKTSMEDIRAASNVSKGTLYLYFNSKEELFTAVVQATFAELQAYLEQAMTEDPLVPVAGRLHTLLLRLNRTLQQDDHRTGLYADFFVQAWQHESVRKALLDAYKDITALLASIIQQGIDSGEFGAVDAELIARILIGTLDGFLLQKLLDPTADVKIKEAATQLAEMIMLRLQSRPNEQNSQKGVMGK